MVLYFKLYTKIKIDTDTEVSFTIEKYNRVVFDFNEVLA